MGWRVWRAFEDDPQIDNRDLWRALIAACKDQNGRLDVAEYERWLEVFIWHRRGQA